MIVVQTETNIIKCIVELILGLCFVALLCFVLWGLRQCKSEFISVHFWNIGLLITFLFTFLGMTSSHWNLYEPGIKLTVWGNIYGFKILLIRKEKGRGLVKCFWCVNLHRVSVNEGTIQFNFKNREVKLEVG